MYYLVANPTVDTVAIIQSNSPLQAVSDDVGIYRLVKSNRVLYRQFEAILTRYHAALKDGKGVVLEKDGTVTLFTHDYN